MNSQHDTTRHAFILLLTLVAGCVDAISFVNAGVFPANMTGNAVVLAISLVNGGHAVVIHREYHAALVLFGFCCGSALAALVIKSDRSEWSRSVNLVILGAGMILLVWGISIGDGSKGFSRDHLFAVSMAMGMQSASVLHLNFPGAGTTTAVTSTLTSMISRIVHHLRAALIPGFHVFLPSPWFPMMVFGVYFMGALVGGLQSGTHTAIAAIISGILIIGVSLGAEFLPRSGVRES
jgi:uncharacterized membrane protein YoaK (UPF0700 family)